MTFDHPRFLLLLLLLPVLWLWMRRAPGASRVCLALKCAAFAALVLALADPWAVLRVQKLAVTVLMDTSASMPRESLQRGEAMLRDLVAQKSGAELRLITFAGHPRLRPLPAQASQVTIPQGVDAADGNATDLGSAMQLALSTFPSQGARRMLLISDGNETQGNALTEALRARERGVPIFTAPSGGTAPLAVKVASIAAPQDVFSGEHFTVSLHLDSGRAMPARVWLTAHTREIASAMADLAPGDNSLDLDARIVESGVSQMDVHVSSNGSEQLLFSQAVTVRRPRVLYVAGGGETSPALLEELKLAEVDVDSAPSFPIGPGPQDWDAVLLDNYPDHDLPMIEQAAIERYVFAGGGLIFIAGDRNAKLARDAKTPFEKVLPVRAQLTPQKPVAVVLVLDKSGSMDGSKIEMVRDAARASIVTLRPVDQTGVIFFDDTLEWVIPMGPAVNLQSKADVIGQVKAGGDTQIYLATVAAFDALKGLEAARKHIILLTDGVQTYKTYSNFPQLEKDAADAHVSISTIGVGDDLNRDLLREMAQKTKGKSYFADNPASIPQIINDEVRAADELAIQEHPVTAIRVQPAQVIQGIDFTHAPQLEGFVQSEAKEGAETILRTDGEKPSPLLARWHYGLGSVTAFMSDAKGRWAAPWIPWQSFGTLWSQMVRDTAHRDRMVRASVRPGARDGEVIVSYSVISETNNEIDASALRLGKPAGVNIALPGGSSQMLPLEETASRHYEVRFLAAEPGMYHVVSGSEGLRLPEVGFYRESEETKSQAVNGALLSEISRVTGGRVRPSIDQLLSDRGTVVSERRPLWPFWLVLALVLNFLEVAIRKGFFDRFTGWIGSRGSASPPQPVQGD